LLIATFQFFIDQNKGNFVPDSFLYETAHIPAIYLFPAIFGFSLLGSFLGTYFTAPTNMETLKSFYKNVRPWGWWKPVLKELQLENTRIERNKDFWIDMLNCFIGVIWQSSMILLPIFLVVRDYPKMGLTFLIFLLSSLILKFTWLDKIRKYAN
jgi:hypothetical protein